MFYISAARSITNVRRLADIKDLRWRDIDLGKTQVKLVIKRHKTSRFTGGKEMHVIMDGAGEADLARMLRAWRRQIFDDAGQTDDNYLAPRLVSGIFQRLPACNRSLQRAHGQLTERLGLKPGKRRHCILCSVNRRSRRIALAQRQSGRRDGRDQDGCRPHLGGGRGRLEVGRHGGPVQQERRHQLHQQGRQ